MPFITGLWNRKVQYNLNTNPKILDTIIRIPLNKIINAGEKILNTHVIEFTMIFGIIFLEERTGRGDS